MTKDSPILFFLICEKENQVTLQIETSVSVKMQMISKQALNREIVYGQAEQSCNLVNLKFKMSSQSKYNKSNMRLFIDNQIYNSKESIFGIKLSFFLNFDLLLVTIYIDRIYI